MDKQLGVALQFYHKLASLFFRLIMNDIGLYLWIMRFLRSLRVYLKTVTL